jgi:two-component system, sensor histidine kinase YesM
MPNSIKFRMMSIFVFIIFTMVASFWISFERQNVITYEYERFMSNNKQLSELPILFSKTAREFSVYFSTRNEENLQQFNLLNEQINETLDNVQSEISEDRNSSIFHRTLYNMQEYQQALSAELIQTDTLNFQVYNDLTYLKNLYSYMSNQSQLLSISYLEYSDMMYGDLLEESKTLERNSYFIIGFFGLVSISFALMLSNGILKKIIEISKVAKLLEYATNWDAPDIKPSKYMELDTVAKTFNRMKMNMQHYIAELKKKGEIERQLNEEKLRFINTEKMLKESQFLSLQRQMNPHFLFNTLNMISRTALLKQNESTIELIGAISKILRFNLDNSGNAVQLSEELKVLQAYMYIQEIRFQERITFRLEVNCDISGVFIPPMLLQPIVENSIIHGLKDTESDGEFSITLDREGELIIIRLQDNGSGMSESQLKTIFENRNEGKTSIGLSNVKERLELYFNQTDLMNITSTTQGTTIMLRIPVQRKEDLL